MSDRSRRSITRTQEKRRSSNTDCIPARRHQLFTSRTTADHMSNRCLQGVCKCSRPGVPHYVVDEMQFGEGGVRLAMFDCSDYPCQRTSGCMHAATHHCTTQSLERHSLFFRPGRKNMRNDSSLIDHSQSHTAHDVEKLGRCVAFAGLNRMRSCRSPPTHSASEHVECAPKPLQKQGDAL